MKKKVLTISSLLVCVLLLFGCSFNSTEPSGGNPDVDKKSEEKKSEKKGKLGDYNVQFTGEVIEQDDKFIIEGKSNLLPGSRLVGEVLVNEDEVFSDTSELVDEKGNFYMELDHHQYGEAEIVVRFDFEGVQEDEVKRHYGEHGQKLEGPFVYKHMRYSDSLKKAEVSVFWDPDNENDLKLKQPDWVKLPDDYGDVRVWIEDVTIEEDGEFFYVSGKTNLLEGSVIEIDFSYNTVETPIKPDGTFATKMDYKYEEETDFLIEFHPGWKQWDSINEVYGEKGQKLVGNLVERDQYSDQQFVKKEIPWSK